jgi:signal transduction histidine kinase
MPDPISILLVDDEKRNLDALEAILDDPSYRLLRASDADTALRLLLAHDVAAIVLDIKMPGISGLELAQLIKGTKKFRQIPIVFLTAYLGDDRDILTGYGAGAVDYLTKPVNPLVFRHKVAVFADLFRKTRALAELNESLEARVRERTEELEKALRSREDLLAIVSHDLRNPLSTVLMGAKQIERCADDSEPGMRTKKAARTICSAVDRMTRLVSDLLDLAKLEAGQRLPIELGPNDGSDLTRQVVEQLEPLAVSRHITLRVDFAAPISIVCDADRVQQALSNLIGNAIKFSREGGSIDVVVRKTGEEVVFSVIDTGMGISSDQVPHLFTPYWQAKARKDGAGLGLAIVKAIVEAHSGRIWVESAPGKGTTFYFALPAGDAMPTTKETT